MALDNGTLGAIVGIGTLLLREGIGYLIKRRKDVKEIEKISAETKVLTASEQRDRARFCEEQLVIYEERLKESLEENEKLRDMLKRMTTQLDELQKKTNETLNDITFLKIELAAYKK